MAVMNPHRANTIVVDFSVLPARPDAAKVHKFLIDSMKLQLSDVKQIQFHNVRKCVFIEMTSFEVACQYEIHHNLKHSFRCGEKNFAIHVYVDCELTTVRVHDLPPSVDNATVHSFMQQFGTVTSITKERWKHYFPGVFNGVRVLHMRLRQPIPSFTTINDFQSLCTYYGQKPTCRVCGNAAHPHSKCSVPTPTSNSKSSPAAVKTSSSETTTHPTADTFSEIVARGRRSLAEASANSQTENNNDDSADDNSSTSSTTTIDPNETNGSSKRRLLTQKANVKKKACQEQCSPNAVPSVDNFDMLNNKNGKGNL